MVSRRVRSNLLARALLALVVLSPFSIASAQNADGKGEHPDKPKTEPTSQPSGGSEGSGRKGPLEPFPPGPRETEFKEKLGSDFKVRRTAHFVVLYDTKEEPLQSFILRLEPTYKSVHRFVTRLGIKIRYPKEKLVLVFCADSDSYHRAYIQLCGHPAPKGQNAISHGDSFAMFYDGSQEAKRQEWLSRAEQLRQEAKTSTNPAERRAKARKAEWYENRIANIAFYTNRHYVQHELAHLVLFNLGIPAPGAVVPGWFVEGMATQFEEPPGKMGAGFNVINQPKLGVIRKNLLPKLPDLREFVGSPCKGGGGCLSADEYSLSWGLVNYLIKQKKKAFPRYVELLNQRKPGEKISPEREISDFELCFGKLDDDFTAKWVAFIKGLPYRQRG